MVEPKPVVIRSTAYWLCIEGRLQGGDWVLMDQADVKDRHFRFADKSLFIRQLKSQGYEVRISFVTRSEVVSERLEIIPENQVASFIKNKVMG